MAKERFDPQERLERYEKEAHELQTQIRFLEDEVGLLRRRLTNAPRQVKILEERLVQSRSDLSKALAQNEKLVSTLKTERDKLEGLKEEVEKLTKPPASFGVYLATNEDGSVDVFTAGRKMRVNVDPEIDVSKFRRGAEVILNEALNVVAVLEQDTQGEVVTVKEHLGEDRVIVIGRGDEEMVATLANSLQGTLIRVGDALLFDPKSGHVLEKLPKQEIEELVLEEVLNKYVGETERQIRLIFQRAKEKSEEGFPVIVFFDEMDSLFRTRGSGISSDVENTIVPQLLSEINGVETLKNVIVIGASNREDMIDPAILRPGRLDVKIKIERPDAQGALDIMSKYLNPGVPLPPDEMNTSGGNTDKALLRTIGRTVERK